MEECERGSFRPNDGGSTGGHKHNRTSLLLLILIPRFKRNFSTKIPPNATNRLRPNRIQPFRSRVLQRVLLFLCLLDGTRFYSGSLLILIRVRRRKLDFEYSTFEFASFFLWESLDRNEAALSFLLDRARLEFCQFENPVFRQQHNQLELCQLQTFRP